MHCEYRVRSVELKAVVWLTLETQVNERKIKFHSWLSCYKVYMK